MPSTRKSRNGPSPEATHPLPSTAHPPGTRFVGLDVHADTIAVAVAEPTGQVHALGIIKNTPTAVAALVKKLAAHGAPLACCYETGPTGYVLYWQLTRLGLHCDVIAVGLIPTKPTDRIKTDRRDAMKLARLYRSGDLTPIWIPDDAHEALRDLVRAREDALEDRMRLRTFLLRKGYRKPDGFTAWSPRHRQWLQGLATTAPCFVQSAVLQTTFLEYLGEVDRLTEPVTRLDQAIRAAVPQAAPRTHALIANLQALRGVAFLTAVTLVTELGTFTRFARATQLMSYTGLTSSEHSSGGRRRQGAITKCGNAHLRRVVAEAAWQYRFLPRVTTAQLRRAPETTERSRAIAWQAQQRLCPRYRRLLAKGKPSTVAITAIARELVGFIWAIGRATEQPIAASMVRCCSSCSS
jgi:transposase